MPQACHDPADAGRARTGQAVRVADDGLAVDQAGPHWQLGNGGRGQREAISKVIALASVKGHASGIAFRQDAKAIVLDLVNPAGPGRRLLGRAGEASLNSRAKCNRALREPDLHVFAKLFEDCLKKES